MKIKHNKKRNTAFVYEVLVREATVAIMKKDHGRKDKALAILKKHFHSNSLLSRDLVCYQSLSENQNISSSTSEKIVKEVRIQRHMINTTQLFKQQTILIHDINKQLTPEVFNNFVANYKSLATIDQIFSPKTSPKNRVILEEEIVKQMSTIKLTEQKEEVPIDNLLFKTFVEKFNKKYEGDLLEEQKELLVRYISSFSDNAVELKYFLNSEVARLKEQLKTSASCKELKEDTEMAAKAVRLIEHLDGFSHRPISDELLLTVLRTQALVKEIYTDVNND